MVICRTGRKVADGDKNVSNSAVDTATKDWLSDFPTRLEHSYFNDNVYWTLGPIGMHDPYEVSNTTIHPRISWKATKPSTRLPNFDKEITTRKWVWPTTASTIMTAFPFERLTHAYDTSTGEGGMI